MDFICVSIEDFRHVSGRRSDIVFARDKVGLGWVVCFTASFGGRADVEALPAVARQGFVFFYGEARCKRMDYCVTRKQKADFDARVRGWVGMFGYDLTAKVLNDG